MAESERAEIEELRLQVSALEAQMHNIEAQVHNIKNTVTEIKLKIYKLMDPESRTRTANTRSCEVAETAERQTPTTSDLGQKQQLRDGLDLSHHELEGFLGPHLPSDAPPRSLSNFLGSFAKYPRFRADQREHTSLPVGGRTLPLLSKATWQKTGCSWNGKQAASDEGAEAKDPRPTSSMHSGPKESSSRTSRTSDPVVFVGSSPNVQVPSPYAKPKIKIAANFQNVSDSSKERLINFDVKDGGNAQKATTPTHPLSSFSRFTLDYDSIQSLDKGSFGRVFKARHKLEMTYYAVKIVQYKKKTLQEVKVLSDLNHCNIVRYHSCWIEDTAPLWDSSSDTSSASQSSTDSPVKFLYIQMELCDVKTLRVWLDEKNIQNPKKSLRDSKRKEESLSIALEIISGVDYIHSRRLIHRDLKPANIMFNRNGTVKIGDFGLVTPVIEDDSENQRERRGYKGTPTYMAPEQKNGTLYDRKVDIFALGLIFFELLWTISTINEKSKILDDVRNQKLPLGFYQHFTEESQLIKSMLSFKPEERPEACKIKTNLEELKRSFEALKTTQRDSRTV